MRIAVRRAALLTLASVVGRTPGFLIPVLVASVFGAGIRTDAYFLAYNTVLLVCGTLAQAVEVSIVPYAARALLASAQAGRRFLGATALRLSSLAAGVWLVVVPVVVVLAGTAVRWPLAGYAACFTPLVFLWSAASVHAGALVAEGDIAAATGSMLWRGGGGLLGLALGPAGGGLWTVALGLGVGGLCRTLWLRRRVLGHARHDVAPETVPEVPFPRALAATVTAGLTLSVVPVIERLLALRLGAGSASHLEYATRLLIVPAALFDGALAPQLLADWSRRVVAEGRPPTRQELLAAVGRGLVIAGALAALLAAFAPLAVGLLLHHGRFSAADAVAVSALLRALAIGFVGSMAAVLTERAYLATSRNRLLAAFAVLRSGLRVAVAVALLGSLHLLAFAVGFAVAEWCYCAALLLAFRSAPVVPLAARRAEA